VIGLKLQDLKLFEKFDIAARWKHGS